MKNQIVVITGASGGIGRAVARAFGARGATVALLARGSTGLRGAADDVRSGGGHPVEIPTDVAAPRSTTSSSTRCVPTSRRCSSTP